MKNFAIILTLFLSLPLFASELIVMKEQGEQKEIWSFHLESSSFSKIETGTNIAIYPGVSRDGNFVSFSGGENLENALRPYLIDRSQGSIKKIDLEGYGHVFHTKISPNGKWLLFSAKNKATEKNEILAYIIATEELKTLASSEHSLYFPAISSDSEILYAQQSISREERNILKIRLASSEVEKVDTGLSNCMAPALSFDDSFLAFTCKVGENWKVFEKNLRTGEVEKVSSDSLEISDYAPSYSSDSALSFASHRSDNFSIYKKPRGTDKKLRDERLMIEGQNFDVYSPVYSGDQNYRLNQESPMPSPTRSSFGSITVGNYMYAIGGHMGAEHTYPPESFTDRVERFDLVNKEWKSMAPRPAKAHGYGVAQCGNYIYAFGGFAYSADHNPKWKSLPFVDRYDIEKDKWTRIGNMPRNRSSNAVIKLENKVYLVGGWDSTPKFDNDIDGTFHEAIDVFDCETESFEDSNLKLPGPKRRAFTGIAYNGKLLLIGGISEGGHSFSLLSRVDLFDPIKNENTEMPELPFGTFAPAAGAIGSDVYVFGGMFKYGKWEYNYVNHIYHFDGSKWQHTGRHLYRTKGFSQVSNYGNKLVVAGGHSYEGGVDEPVDDLVIWSKK